MTVVISLDLPQSATRHAENTNSLQLASRVPLAKDCADCGLADRGLELASSRFRDLGPPRGPL
eukprot:6485971-Alexandrium_andersonii.AAC.1